ncbi:Uncharacterized protein dnm_027180 [Desulfonema magnum]|uniref:Uncharacterized protein n=1 Tax=Desulfonema magnum TaxID=45655 RepID=A0A975BKE6_9BACT|nr:Uncharacterized protein dnm_027180 [Desulfonema magnum]
MFQSECLSKSFLYIFFSANRGETRLFPSQAAGHSGKKAGFLFRANIENLWLGTYLGLQNYYATQPVDKKVCLRRSRKAFRQSMFESEVKQNNQ